MSKKDKKDKQLQQRQSSMLRKFVPCTHGWLDSKTPLKDAQAETATFLEGEEIFEETRETMIEKVRDTETLEELVKYLYDSLLFWEGDGV